MLIPDSDGALHVAILTEISPPITRDVAEDVQLLLYTRYVKLLHAFSAASGNV
jgi:hypothetical protein